MRGTGRLLAIEVRRNIGLWLLPAFAGLGWFTSSVLFDNGDSVPVWPQISTDIGLASVLLMPAAGGLAAWVAGRDRRRGLDELLATTPTPEARRDLSLLGATALWVLVGYLAVGVYFASEGVREASWGGPVAAPIVLGLVSIATGATIGFAVGSVVRGSIQGRLAAALVPVGLFFAELAPTLIQGKPQQVSERGFATSQPYADLSPVSVIETVAGTVFQAADLDRFWSAMTWLLGLGGVALSLMLLRRLRIRNGLALGMLAVSVAAAGVGAAQLVPAEAIVRASPDRAISYEPVCVERSIPICLHPAYSSVLDETADLVEAIVRPLVGMPGFPVRAEQPLPLHADLELVLNEFEPLPADTLAILPLEPDMTREEWARFVTIAAVNAGDEIFPFGLTPPQSVLAIWLMEQAGWEMDPSEYSFLPFGVASTQAEVDAVMAEVFAAADRFAALTPDARHDWLVANFAALRAGELTLAEMP